MKKFKGSGNTKVPKYQPQERGTSYYTPPLPNVKTTDNIIFSGKPWENKPMYIGQEQKENGSARTAEPKRGALSKAVAVARNPMTAVSYAVQNKQLPDYFDKGDRNVLESATDIVNPMTYIDAAKRVAMLEHFKGANSTGDYLKGLGLTAMDAAMVYGIGNEFELGSKSIANPLGKKSIINAEEAAKWSTPGRTASGAPRYANREGMSNIWSEVDRDPINVPTIRLKQAKSMRVPVADGNNSGFGSVNSDGKFVSFINEPLGITNSPEFETNVKNLHSKYLVDKQEAQVNAEIQHQKLNEALIRNGRKPLTTFIQGDVVKPFLSYDLQSIEHASKIIPGVNTSQFDNQQTQQVPQGEYVPNNIDTDRKVPQPITKEQFKKLPKAQQKKIVDSGEGNYNVMKSVPYTDIPDTMYHFPTREAADSMVHAKGQQYGGPINEDTMKKNNKALTMAQYNLMQNGGMFWDGKQFRKTSPAVAAGSMYQNGGDWRTGQTMETGGYVKGSQHELEEHEIQNLINQGYKIKYL